MNEKKNMIYEILGLSKREYDEMFRRFSEEYKEILDTRSFTKASEKLLRWLGLRNEEITTDKIIKGIVIVKVAVQYINDYYRLKYKFEGA